MLMLIAFLLALIVMMLGAAMFAAGLVLMHQPDRQPEPEPRVDVDAWDLSEAYQMPVIKP
jgi:hypothetical protein